MEKLVEQRIQKKLLLARILCGALAFSVVLYVWVANFVASRPMVSNSSTTSNSHSDRFGLFVALAFVALMSFLNRRKKKEPDKAEHNWQHYFLRVVLKFVIADAIALGGMVLTITRGNLTWSYVGSAVSLLLMVAWWPRKREIELAMMAS